MNILHLIPTMHPAAGGPPVVAHQWCKQLNLLGHHTHILTTDAFVPSKDDGEWLEHLRQDTAVDMCKSNGPFGFAYSSTFKSRLNELLLRSAQGPFDLVHVHNLWSYANRLIAGATRRAGIPFVVSTHGMMDPHSLTRKAWKKRLYGHLLEWPVLRKASAICFTHPEEERLAGTVTRGLPQGKIVPLGAEPPALGREELRQRFASHYPNVVGKQVALFLGRLHEKKGPDLLLKGFARLNSERRPHLLMVGPGEDEYRRQLEQIACDLGIRQDVTFTGPLSGIEKDTALAGSDVFVLPSHQENFALTVVESLFAGTPVVLSNRVNLWQDLVNADAGIRCDRTSESIADCLEKVLDDESKQIALRNNGLKLAKTAFTWERSTALLAQAYYEVLA